MAASSLIAARDTFLPSETIYILSLSLSGKKSVDEQNNDDKGAVPDRISVDVCVAFDIH
ncbi:hypothetical protein KIN20_012933 [Parelaphostrongylus tenuis]|uniref:Uncharacterized protein n=1 Tax=Parelaphostrongylus tenuis TaxID=148309 RepID=A0AAD5QM84_PARTN|nr:hypothetical protein KIN20_012933 [Parelaphostrongylus tenuis]